MRQIEFRAWDKNSEKYIDLDKRHNGILYHRGELHISQGWDGVGLPTFWQSEDDINYHKRDCVFEQFTGLLDKNGVKIFEGDEVTLFCDDVLHGWVIVFQRGAFGYMINDIFVSIASNSNFTFNDNTVNEIKVISNIHQNKEL